MRIDHGATLLRETRTADGWHLELWHVPAFERMPYRMFARPCGGSPSDSTMLGFDGSWAAHTAFGRWARDTW